MPECHKCEHNQNKALRKLPYKQTPCAKCKAPSYLSHHGRNFVSLDADQPAVENLEIRAVSDKSDAVVHGASVFSRIDLQAGLHNLLELLRSNPVTARIVIYRICHPAEPLHKIAKSEGISVQAAHSRLQKAAKKWPELKHVIPKYNTKKGHEDIVIESNRPAGLMAFLSWAQTQKAGGE